MLDNDIQRRRFLKGVGGTAGAGLIAGCSGGSGSSGGGDSGGQDSGGNSSNSFPSRPVTFVVPYGKGGYNYYTRLVAKYIQKKNYLPTEVSVKNVSGGGGIVATNQVYNAKPDGYTNMIVNGDAFATSQVSMDSAKYDLSKMTFYPRIAGSLPSLAVSPKSDIQTAQDLVNAFANEEVKLAAFGWTSVNVITALSLGVIGNLFENPVEKIINSVIVYGGRGEAITAMKRGEVDVTGGSYSSVLPYVKSGDVQMTLVFNNKDTPPEETPNADTLKDLNVNNPQEIISFIGATYHRYFAGPPGIPENRAKTIRTALRKAIQDPDLQKEAAENDRPVNFMSSDKVETGVKKMIQTWSENKELLTQLEKQRS